jgi:hypothetical protein
VFLDGDHFVQQMQQKAKGLSEDFNIPKTQRRQPGLALEEKHRSLLIIHNEDIVAMYATDEYSYSQIAVFLTYISQKLERLQDQQKQITGKQMGGCCWAYCESRP